MTHYATIDPQVHDRLRARGINAEASTEAFLAECRDELPLRLVRSLTGPGTTHGQWGYRCGCRCLVCADANRDAQRRWRARQEPGRIAAYQRNWRARRASTT